MEALGLRLLFIDAHQRFHIHDSAHKRHSSRAWHQLADPTFFIFALRIPFTVERIQRVGELFFCEAVAGFGECRYLEGVGWEADFGFVEGLD